MHGHVKYCKLPRNMGGRAGAGSTYLCICWLMMMFAPCSLQSALSASLRVVTNLTVNDEKSRVVHTGLMVFYTMSARFPHALRIVIMAVSVCYMPHGDLGGP